MWKRRMEESRGGTVTVETRLEEAASLAESGEYLAARRLVRQILAEEPYNFEARELMDRLAGVQWLGESRDVPPVVQAAGCIGEAVQLVTFIIAIGLAIGFLFWLLQSC